MTRMIVAAALAAIAGVIMAAQAANARELNGTELRKTVAGKTVYLASSGIVLPIIYRANGTMSGKLEAFAASLAGSAPSDTGRWWITKNQLCQKWNKWLGGKSYCFRVKKQGKSVTWVRNDGRSGTARIGG